MFICVAQVPVHDDVLRGITLRALLRWVLQNPQSPEVGAKPIKPPSPEADAHALLTHARGTWPLSSPADPRVAGWPLHLFNLTKYKPMSNCTSTCTSAAYRCFVRLSNTNYQLGFGSMS